MATTEEHTANVRRQLESAAHAIDEARVAGLLFNFSIGPDDKGAVVLRELTVQPKARSVL